MGCSPEKVENPAASRSPDRHRWQAPPDPRLKPRKNTHFHLLKDASHTLRMEQPRPLDGSKVQTLASFSFTSAVQSPPWLVLSTPGQPLSHTISVFTPNAIPPSASLRSRVQRLAPLSPAMARCKALPARRAR